ncbi:hypothetical protein CRG49_002085 [Neisseria sp. N95_16]|uniref:Uncharacterized protein n=1 Tax=Neisseria brasiliensis TaxID=2666100 RepID=A0A7X2H0R2_9NEIS|nr:MULTISPECIES: hypothetical protein [Neisseria]MRN38577.1 hypothetical protein [Neisseria brasiliensis]PJO10494.1 hypothetical protein CRG49_002085 [Neisseria sp. N95_16]
MTTIEHGKSQGHPYANLIRLRRKTNFEPYKKQLGALNEVQRIELLDTCCDQIVTAVGVAYMLGMDIEGALAEVIRNKLKV